MNPARMHIRFLLAVVSGLVASATLAPGQIQCFATYEGKRAPVVAVYDHQLVVSWNGSTMPTASLDVEVRPAKGFTDGMVTISNIQASLHLLQHASARERTDPSAIRAKYKATVVADRRLSSCYGLLTCVAEGSVGTKLISIGRLTAGRPHEVEVEMTNEISSVGSLHIFSEGQEIRTNQHPEPYDVFKYYAELTKDSKGIPAAALLRLAEMYPHALSDDGRYVATVRRRDTNKLVFVYDLTRMKVVTETVIAGEEEAVDDLRWVSDHELVYLAEDPKDNFGRILYLLDANRGTTRKVLSNVSAVVRSATGHPEVLEVVHSKFGSAFMKCNALTGATYETEDPSAGLYYFDMQGTPRVRVRHDGAKQIYEFRPTADSKWRNLDDSIKEPGLKFSGTSADLLDPLAEVHSIAPDGDTLYISTRLNRDKAVLAAFSMSRGVITQTIAEHPKYDLNGNGSTRFLYAKGSSQLLGMVYEGQKPQVTWLDPRYAAVQKAIDGKYPDHVNLPIDWSVDGHTLVYFSFSDQDPGVYVVVRTDAGEVIPLLRLSEQLGGKKLGRTTPVEFTARDGAKIPGYITRPPTQDAAPPPLIVIIHGGPMVRDTWRFNPENQFFATRGYVVLQVNYRGSGGYGTAFESAGLRARLDTMVIDDIADGVGWLIGRQEVDPTRIAVMGASFGGWATYICLARYPDLFRVGIPISAVTS